MAGFEQRLGVDVAIIGGGFSGAMVAAQLLRQARRPLVVAIVERRAELGRGVAYGTTDTCHLLNVPAAGMSAWPDEPGHFLAWLRTQPGFEAAEPTTFAPRRMYGAYVQAVLAAAEAHAAEGVRLLRVHDEAIALRVRGAGAAIELSSGRSLEAGRVVLALGHFPPADPPVPGGAGFYQSDRYVAEPWTSGALDHIGPDEPVLLIGSGLTAIDLALSLSERGHRGRVHMLSRRGMLPQPHVPGLAAKSLTPPSPPYRACDLYRWVRQEVRAGQAEGLDWRQVVDGLRPHLQGLWKGLPAAERRRFLRHARASWEVHRHRMAPEVAGAIAELRASGRLIVHAGRLQGFEGAEDGVRVRWRTREGQTTHVVHRVINCTGPEADYRKKRHPLAVSLLEQGLVRPDALGMGIEVDATGAVLDAHGRASMVLFALGPTLKGELWETTAVPEIRVQAADRASRLAH